jgi:glycosyltransferase involved in cell wall biosynthesis
MNVPSSRSALSSIVLPVHNQADHIDDVVDGHVAALERLGFDYQLILVTNNCSDNSADRCAALGERYRGVEHVDTPLGGWGHAVRLGLAEARGETVGYANSARTTPQMLALMVAYARAYPEVVVKANRRIRESVRRRLGSLLYNLECRALFDLAVWDINGTPKIFPRKFDALLALQSDDDLLDAEFAAVCAASNYPVVEVPILATTRYGGRSTTNYRSAARMYWGALRLKRRTRRPR